ncbi:TolC family protein [Pseudofrancisella aestuarii]|uniref:TolC family protein n=1 Tax=Pseudofrancisella aestuarii TaxID=2670347 RepID=A0ABV9TC97_9GAMM
MKKTLSFLFLSFVFSNVFAAYEKPLGSDVAKNPYSVEKQYAKADEIREGNSFYNLKSVEDVAVVDDKEEKQYSLIEIYKLAAKHNAEYQSARSTFAGNMETVPKALGYLLPQIDFGYNLRRDRYNQFGGIVKDTSNNLMINGTQTLFDWSKWKTFTQAMYLQKSYAMIYAKAEQDLIINTVTAYFELLRAQQVLQFQFANEAWNKKLYINQEQQYQAGIVSYADLKTSDAQYRKAIASRADAQKQLIQAKATLAKLVGKKINSLLYVAKGTDYFGPPVPNDVEYWLETSQKYNLDIAQKAFAFQATTEGVGIKWGNFFPNVNFGGGLTASFNDYTGSPQELVQFPTDYQIANLQGNVNWNLLRGGSDYAQLKQASYDNQASNYTLLQTQREVYAGIVESFETVRLDAIRIQAYEKSVYAGLASVKAILEGYQAGTQTIVDLLNRQAILVEAQLAFAGSIFNYVEHYAQLKQLQGSLTYEDVEQINTSLGKENIISAIAAE